MREKRHLRDMGHSPAPVGFNRPKPQPAAPTPPPATREQSIAQAVAAVAKRKAEPKPKVKRDPKPKVTRTYPTPEPITPGPHRGIHCTPKNAAGRVLALVLTEGPIKREAIAEHIGVDLEPVKDALMRLRAAGYILPSAEGWRAR